MSGLTTSVRTILTLCFLVGAGCNQSDFGQDDPIPPGEVPPGPGDPAWGDQDVSCETKADCSVNEDCLESVCQMARCTDGPYDSTAPLGPEHYFFADLELVTADDAIKQGEYWVDSYLPSSSALTYPTGGGSYRIGNYKPLDVSGGNVLGSRPERFAFIQEGRESVTVFSSNPVTMPLSYQPVAVGTGDVDHDSIDEVITIGAGRKFSVCHADEQRCETYEFGTGISGKDVAAGDVDGDGYDEAVFMVMRNGKTELLSFNYDHETSEEDQILGLVIDTEYLAMDVGDPDGNGIAEIYALEDGGFAGFAKDHVHAWQIGNTTRLGNKEVDADSRDITLADTDMSNKDKLLVLRDTRTVEVYEGTGPGLFSAMYTSELNVSSSPRRIAMADVDGDTPSARRISDAPEIIAGQPVPTMVLTFPPYSKSYSSSPPGLYVGEGTEMGQDFTDTVGLSAGITIGVGAEFPGVFSVDVSASMTKHVSLSRTVAQSKQIGMRFRIDADPELYGDDYSVVVLSSACYHSYKYELRDPENKVGGDGGEFILLVPVGGQTTVWSSQRYNALARALGTLPEVATSAKLGDPSSYPSSPMQIGSTAPVSANDMLFGDVPSFLVSDVGSIGWWLSASERETNSAAESTYLDVSTSVKVNGFKVGASAGVNFGSAYGVTVGRYAMFGGGVSQVPDDPSTPEDEYAAHRYSFSPYVYRENYEDADGNPAGYYVLAYAAGE